jgi:hypothetical protein
MVIKKPIYQQFRLFFISVDVFGLLHLSYITLGVNLIDENRESIAQILHPYKNRLISVKKDVVQVVPHHQIANPCRSALYEDFYLVVDIFVDGFENYQIVNYPAAILVLWIFDLLDVLV